MNLTVERDLPKVTQARGDSPGVALQSSPWTGGHGISTPRSGLLAQALLAFFPLQSTRSVWGARASCCVAWATLDLPPTSSLTETLRSSLSLQNFAKEFVISDRKELEEDFIRSELKKAGGANYDAQSE